MSIRVMQVIPHLGAAGAETMVVNLAAALRAAGCDPLVVTLYPRAGTALERRLEREKVSLIQLGKRLGFERRIIGHLAAAVSRCGPDIVHTHLGAFPYAYLATRTARTPMVHTVHNVAHKEALAVVRGFQWVAFRRRATPVAIGGNVAASIREVYGLRSVVTIPHGIPLDAYQGVSPERGALWRERHGIGPAKLVFVCIARLSAQKNVGQLLSAFRCHCRRVPGSVLLIVGDGPERATLERESGDLVRDGRVHFLGIRDDIPEVLSASDVFVLASRWEGNPISIMEAMAAGRPVVCPPVGGVPELVVAGVTGLTPTVGDERALAAALTAMAEPRTRLAMGEASRVRAGERFAVAVMAKRYAELYRSIATKGAQRMAG